MTLRIRCFFMLLLFSCFLCLRTAAAEDCFETHAAAKGLDADLLRAIALVESAGNPKAVGKNAASEDLGLMQINSGWLSRFKTTRSELLSNACFNVEVGAHILADNLDRIANPWEAVGAYNAACTKLKGDDCTAARQKYAWKVYRALMGLSPESRQRLGKLFS